MKTLAKHVSRSGPLSVRDAIGWVYRAACTLVPMHSKGVAHGAISSRALLIAEASCRSVGELLDSHDAAANPLYFSTVRTEGGGPSLRDDVWGLTVLLYFALCGKYPFPKGLGAAKRGKGWVRAQPIGMHRSELIEMQPFFEALLRPGEWGADNVMDLIGILNEFSPVVTSLGPLEWRDVAPKDTMPPPAVEVTYRSSTPPDDDDWPEESVKTGQTEVPPALRHAPSPAPKTEAVQAESAKVVSSPPPEPAPTIPMKSSAPNATRTVSLIVLAAAAAAIAVMMYRNYNLKGQPSAASSAVTSTSTATAQAPAPSSPSSSASAAATTIASDEDVNQCIIRSLPRDAFGGSPPKLGYICDGGNVIKLLDRTAELLVQGSQGKVTTATREWQELGLYRLGLLAAVRGRCCSATEAMSTPAMYGTCKLDAALRAIESNMNRGDKAIAEAHQTLGEAIRCLATAGAPATFHVYENPTTQQSARFIRVLKRTRATR